MQAKDQYKLKVNTKKGREEVEEEEIHYHVWKSIFCPLFAEETAEKRELESCRLHNFDSLS